MRGPRQTALELDAAIDGVLLDHRQPHDAAESDLTATARILRDVLPRFHPRLTFEEHLARRLAAVSRTPVAAAPTPTPIGRHGAGNATAVRAPDPAAAERRRRSLVAGGAIASGVSLAIPIAGAAIVVWRRSRSSGGLL